MQNTQRIAETGHNNPPSDAETLTLSLQDNHAAALDHAQKLILAANNIPAEIADDATAEKASDYIKLVMGRKKTLETARVAEKEPYLTLGRVVDGFFKGVTDALDGAQAKAKRPLDVYLKAKAEGERRARIAAAEEERRIAEEQRMTQEALRRAEQAAAADAVGDIAAITEKAAERLEKAAEARPAELAKTRSAQGALASLRTRWVGRLVDRQSLDAAKLLPYFSEDSIQKAINAFVAAGGRKLGGAVIEEISETIVR